MSSFISKSLSKIKITDWTAKVEGVDCIHVKINDNVNIDDIELTLISENRVPIFTVPINAREIFIKSEVDMPMFIQIGQSVHFVEGSGGDFYKDKLKEN